MVSNDVANEKCKGSLVFLKYYCIGVLNDLIPTTILSFVCAGCGLEFGLSLLVNDDFKFSSQERSMIYD